MKELPLTVLLALSSAQAVTITHDLGKTELSKTPKRIITLEHSFTDALVQLGVKPIGVAQDGGKNLAYLDAFLKNVAPVGTRAQPSLEKILALKPDLIIADTERHKNIYAQLSRIAPTISLNSFRGDYPDMLSQFRTIAQALGREQKAQTLLDDHNRMLNKAKAYTRSKAGPLMVMVLSSQAGATVHSTESFIGSLFQKMGRTNPVRPQNGEIQYTITLENIVAQNPATIVLLKNEGEATPLDSWKKDPLWNSLSAVKNNRVYIFDRDLWSKARGLKGMNLIFSQMISSGVLADRPAK
ncbi:ABC transporter substrate-binding protein [Deinococcus cellulosilyticus]|uniref:Fe(3+)-citrate-binding protein YfmC n=1 Tax=Deinococcus cellulosilyticus (strain DSM 18568 / NBRC 106333 / KACC 11606 / 5516J-15) TaxID=1223518 RepID=A0A511MWC3_DEIC1|nr:ABC transporter substrate-binding protein [Deinococcus cellulosilyticus]GEM44691.1 Fe(3+)-citrate-binding protein YfmC [Deinococcus cellulosilyticus NBRC 106333 = KACC 11606]